MTRLRFPFTMVRLLITAVLMISLSACERPAAEDFELGAEAEQAGNYGEAYWRWRPLADQGDARAQYRLAWLYASGHGLVLDMQAAMAWWRKAADQGHADAAFALATAYRSGEGIKRDPASAVKWLLRAQELGVEDAGPILLSMAGVGVDDAERIVRQRLGEPAWDAWGGGREIKAERANLRSGAGTQHAVAGSLEQGQQVLLLHQEGDWARIGVPGKGLLAWIYVPLLK